MNRPIWIGSAASVALLSIMWWALSPAAEPEQDGVVRLAAGAPVIADAAPPPAAPAAAKRIAIVATQREIDRADDQSFRVAREKRDRAWAERSEAAIGTMMRSIAYIGGARRLEITCAATLCEVVGIADPDPATNSYRPVWEALERDTAGEALRAEGLERVAAIFDTGRIPEEFKIQYRRTDTVPVS